MRNFQAGDGEEDLSDLFENAPCGYLSADPGGRIIKANATLCHWLAMSRDALVGRRFQDLLNIAGKIYFETHFAPLLRMQGFFNEVALEFVLGDGRTMPVLVNAIERRSERGVQFIRIIVFNASDRRRYERELLEARREAERAAFELKTLNETLNERVAEEVKERLRAEEALRQAQKMETIGQLTGGVAHDFNNLLTVIMGGIERLRKYLSDLPPDVSSDRALRAADMVSQGAERAAKLTKHLLAFSRRQPLEPKPLDVGRLVTGLGDFLRRTLGETVELETVVGAGLWRTFVDANELENALVNLTINARDAMTAGGRLTLEVSNAYLDDEYVLAIPEQVPAGQYVLVAVSDTGHGMASETIAQAFEPFFTTKGVGRGTGLGLSQVYGFIRQSGGHVRIYSELEEGTTVKLYFPRYFGNGEMDEIAKAPQLDVTGGRECILVVEDEVYLREYSAVVLRELGYHVLEAADAAEAAKIVDAGLKFDLLFTDVVLPGGVDGRMLAERLLKTRPHVKVLFTTGYTRNAIVHNGRLDPGVQLISKPFSSTALGAKVRQVLDN